MNKDTVTHIYHISIIVTLICIAVLLWGIKQNVELYSMRPQNVRIINSEEITTSKNDKSIQDVRIINSVVPIDGSVTINSGPFGDLPVRITNDGYFNGKAIPVRVER